jgi:hypothetical protein
LPNKTQIPDPTKVLFNVPQHPDQTPQTRLPLSSKFQLTKTAILWRELSAELCDVLLLTVRSLINGYDVTMITVPCIKIRVYNFSQPSRLKRTVQTRERFPQRLPAQLTKHPARYPQISLPNQSHSFCVGTIESVK